MIFVVKSFLRRGSPGSVGHLPVIPIDPIEPVRTGSPFKIVVLLNHLPQMQTGVEFSLQNSGSMFSSFLMKFASRGLGLL